ncbi:MAG: hypothetical protein EPO21_01335 [Chloroflexota bacterium]|nr:MAG: hypothetical protein EPO21_01335 [Chloroflexota bacterium]
MLTRSIDRTLTARSGSVQRMRWLEERLLLALLTLLPITAALYLGYVLVLESELAYPVDDAWIHQTFARNLLRYGELVYNPGEPSSASTSPLWTMLLAGGYYLRIDHRIWSYLLGLLLLGLTGLLARDIFRTLYPRRPTWAALAGLGVVLEPHLGWAALSGMETTLFILLSLLLLRGALNTRHQPTGRHGWWGAHWLWSCSSPVVIGVLGALLVMTRPEGLLLFALVLAAEVVRKLFHAEPVSHCQSEPLSALAHAMQVPYCHCEPQRRISSLEGRPAPERQDSGSYYDKRGDPSLRLTMTKENSATEENLMAVEDPATEKNLMAVQDPATEKNPGAEQSPAKGESLVEEQSPAAGAGLIRAVGDVAVSPALMLLFFLLLLVPYAIFNYRVTGQLLPSTYYAKNVFYAQQTNPAGMVRFLLLAVRELLSGPLLGLFPGLLFAFGVLAARLWRAGVRMSLYSGTILAWLPILWCAGLIVAYMLRLPVVYHHGRYLMPVIPVLLIYGLWGTLRLCEVLPMRLLARVIPMALAAFWVVLWVNGAVVYAWDVKFIDEENVTVARWLRDNTPPGVLVATHDIGAIGYFGGRPILDIAGLITPELAPFVRQPDRVLSYLENRRPAYLAMYPSWYPWLARDSLAQEVYRVDQSYAIKIGLDNMVVYKLDWGQGSN